MKSNFHMHINLKINKFGLSRSILFFPIVMATFFITHICYSTNENWVEVVFDVAPHRNRKEGDDKPFDPTQKSTMQAI